MTVESRTVDRAALVRRAMVELVAERGIHGTSMSQVAERAGVATGTAYVHYESKEELIIAAFVELKTAIGSAATEGIDMASDPKATFESVWRNIHDYLEEDTAKARFLVQLEGSPLRQRGHDALGDDDPLTATAEGMSAELVDLPAEILYDLGLAPCVRLVADGVELSEGELNTLIESCWRAISASG